MTKRANPYSDDFQPQLKIHVGFKEIHNTADKMKSVYDKTIEILFEGANQKDNTNNNQSTNKSSTPARQSEPYSQSKSFKQMFFGKNGCLQISGHQIQAEAPKLCTLCSVQPAESWVSCGYCEILQCSGCALVCTACNSATCSNCSVDSFRGSGGIFCLSCCR